MKKLAKERRRPYNSGELLGRNSVISMNGDRRSSTFSVTAAALNEKSKPRDLLAWYGFDPRELLIVMRLLCTLSVISCFLSQ